MTTEVTPAKFKLILLLLGEELKSCKFFSTLRQLGLEDTFYQTDLSACILNHLGLDAEQHEVLDRYFQLLAHYSKQVETTTDSVQECAFRFYMDLQS